MNELTIHKPGTNPYSQAMATGNLIVAINDNDGKSQIIDILLRIYWEVGQTIDKNSLALLVSSFYDELKIHFPALTIEEVKLCLQKGIRKHYGDYYGLNIATFHIWLSAYSTSKERLQAADELRGVQYIPGWGYKQLAAAEKKENGYEEMEKEWWGDLWQSQFKRYKATGELYPVPALQFYQFENRGLIEFDQSIYDKAEEKVIARKNREKSDYKKRGEIKTFLEHIENNCLNRDEQTEIEIEATIIFIKNYYDSISVFPEVK